MLGVDRDLEDGEFSVSTAFFFEHVQHYDQLEAFNLDSRAPLFDWGNFQRLPILSSEFNGEVSCK